MENHQVHQLIYTKLNPEDSPYNKKDFHTAFYPLNFLTNTDVLVIENHIYIPPNEDFAEKQIVYFQDHKNEILLYIFDINVLKDEVDTIGRAGIFMCHVFIFPEIIWKKIPSPDKLLELVSEYKYRSRLDLLNSPFIDKKTGNMMPIQISGDRLDEIDNKLPLIENTFEGQVLLMFQESMQPENTHQKIILAAAEIDARKLFNKLICYLPNDQKVQISWDTMYDGGRMMDYNKKIVAYQQRAPKGGSGETVIYFQNKRIEHAKDFIKKPEHSPFVNWVIGCYNSISYPFYIEEATILSNAILNKASCEFTDNWNIECFAKVNSKTVENLFLKKCKKDFKKRLRKELMRVIPIKDQLLFSFDKLEMNIFSGYLLEIIENRKIAAWRIKNAIPSNYINHNPLLILIEQLWRQSKFDVEQYYQLSPGQKLQLNRYIQRTSYLKTSWFLDLIRQDETLLEYYTRQFPKPKKIIRLLRSQLNMKESQISQLGFHLDDIRKVLYFKIEFQFSKFKNIFRK